MGNIESGKQRCPACWGTGYYTEQEKRPCRKQHFPNQFCWDCGNTGMITVEVKKTCLHCGGSGRIGL